MYPSNMFLQILSGIYILLLCSCTGQELTPDPPAGVFLLDQTSFDGFINIHPLVTVLFSRPGCSDYGRSVELLDNTRSALHFLNAPLAIVPCHENMALCRYHRINTCSTIKLFENSTPIVYKGGKSTEELATFIARRASTGIISISRENLAEVKALDDAVVIAYISGEDLLSIDAFKTLYDTHGGNAVMGLTSDPEIASEEGLGQPSVVAYHPHTGERSVLAGAFSEASLESRYKMARTPYVGRYDESIFREAMDEAIPVGYFFLADTAQHPEFVRAYTHVGKKYRDRIRLVTLDGFLYRGWQHAMRLSPGHHPAFAIHDVSSNAKFPFAPGQGISLSPDTIAKFIDDVLSGRVKPIVQSEEESEALAAAAASNSSVTPVVASSFDRVVIDSDEDVLLNFYSPSCCPSCESFAPIYEGLAAHIAGMAEGERKVVVANIDASKNDVPFFNMRWPDVKLFPAGAKNKPIDLADVDLATVETLWKAIAPTAAQGLEGDDKGAATLVSNDVHEEL